MALLVQALAIVSFLGLQVSENLWARREKDQPPGMPLLDQELDQKQRAEQRSLGMPVEPEQW
jgi:hypothetical protein